MPLHTSMTWRNRRNGSIFAAVAVAILMTATVSSAEQKLPVIIRVISAQTNQPIPDERLNVALSADQIGSVAMPTDKNGLIVVDTGDASTIRILSNMYADCRSRGELYTNYSIADIRRSGITTGNLCSSASRKAKPGELILYETKRTIIPVYPAQPLPERRLP
jgi:hypothetical protein